LSNGGWAIFLGTDTDSCAPTPTALRPHQASDSPQVSLLSVQAPVTRTQGRSCSDVSSRGGAPGGPPPLRCRWDATSTFQVEFEDSSSARCYRCGLTEDFCDALRADPAAREERDLVAHMEAGTRCTQSSDQVDDIGESI